MIPLAASAAILNAVYFRSLPWRHHVDAGLEFASSHKLNEAEREWRDALRVDPSRLEPYQLLSRLYLDTDRPELAIPLLERLKQVAPRTPHVLCSLADAYTRTDQVKTGMETARQAVVMEPGCARAHAILGVHLGQAEQTRAAIEELEKAHALAPADDKIAISLAQARLDAMDYDGAEKLARDVLGRSPRYASAWYTLGRAFTRRTPTPENLRVAIDAFSKTVALNPAIGDAYSELGRLKVLAGDPEGAVKALKFTWDRGVRTKEAAYNLATAYRKLGRTKESEAMSLEFKRLSDYQSHGDILRKRLTVDPRNRDAALDLAELEATTGSPADAMGILSIVLRDSPKDARALKLAVTASERLKQKDLAAAYRKRLESATAGGSISE